MNANDIDTLDPTSESAEEIIDLLIVYGANVCIMYTPVFLFRPNKSSKICVSLNRSEIMDPIRGLKSLTQN